MTIPEISVGNVSVGLFKSQEDLLDTMICQLDSVGWSFATAVNPEKIISAKKDEQLGYILEQCTLRYADGIGVVRAVKRKTGIIIPRLPGCEVWEALMCRAGRDQNLSVFLVGAKPDVLEHTVEKLKAEYSAPVVGCQHGYYGDEEEVIAQIKTSGANIVSVALGSPRQEKFIFKCREAGINAIFMGVGGTYDVYTGNVKRAPRLWCNLGMEWLYRLLSQPSRIFRQRKLFEFLILMWLRKL